MTNCCFYYLYLIDLFLIDFVFGRLIFIHRVSVLCTLRFVSLFISVTVKKQVVSACCAWFACVSCTFFSCGGDHYVLATVHSFCYMHKLHRIVCYFNAERYYRVHSIMHVCSIVLFRVCKVNRLTNQFYAFTYLL